MTIFNHFRSSGHCPIFLHLIIQELAAAKKATKQANGRSCREQALFYSTSLLAVIAMSAGSSLLFLVPLYVDPAISTLASNFVTEPVTCITTRREDMIGLANCSWSSCREGCTSDAYHCTHIYVSYNDSKVIIQFYYHFFYFID